MENNSISYDLKFYENEITKVVGTKSFFVKEDILKYLCSKYSVEIFENFSDFLDAQSMKKGDFGVNTVEEYTDGLIEDEDMLIYCIFRNPKDFTKITYKDDDFYTEFILQFDKENCLVDYFGTGDYIDFENEIKVFTKKKVCR